MSKSLLYLSLTAVLLVVGAVGVMAYRSQYSSITPMPVQVAPTAAMPAVPVAPMAPVEPVQSVIVERSDSGFSPASVTVKKGTAVKFINKSSTPMSVASDPHPTHTNYPEFDQYKSTFKGKSEYDFTFEKVGTWGYHNHLNPSQTGTVMVTE